jgi:hypothetical protein
MSSKVCTFDGSGVPFPVSSCWVRSVTPRG